MTTLQETTTDPTREANPPPGAVAIPTVQPTVTYVLLALNILAFVAMYIIEQLQPLGAINPLLEFGVLDYNSIVLNHEIYRLVTSMFLHLSAAHIFFNMYALYSIGRGLESIFGHLRFLLIYLIAGLAGSLFSFIIGRGASAGASGAIFGIFSAQLVYVYRHREAIGPAANDAIRNILLLAGLNLGIGFLTAVLPGGVRIDNWGHIGGFVGGLIATTALAPTFAARFSPENTVQIVDTTPLSTRWPLAALLLIIEVVIAFGAMLALPPQG